jgi:hypothetical protein
VAALVVRAVRALVDVVAGFMSLTADAHLTMDGSLGMNLSMIQMSINLMLYRPEDMFGSLEVDSKGQFVGENGNYQPSGMVPT